MANKIEFREGDVLAGKYRVDRVLGAGGMGVVVAAHHLGLDTRVAVKLMLPEMLEHQDIVARFAREARAAARITNEHVARVFDVGTLDGGAPYMVMEFLDGIDLHHWLHEQGPLSVPRAVDFLLQACEAIAEAHNIGIVHRDLKPANLFCVRRPDGAPFIKVLDFGISKISSGVGGAGSHPSITRTSAAMGTPFYMSPEQMESAREVDGRSDIWALGVILFELLSGKVPFGGTSLPEVCIKVATQPAPPIRRVRPDVPEGVEMAILRCLEKDRNKRFPVVGELVAALAPFGSRPGAAEALSRATQAAPSATESAGASALDAKGDWRAPWMESLSAVGHTQAHVSRRRTAVFGFVGGAVVLCVVAAVVVVGLLGRSAPSAAPNATPRANAEGVAPAPSPAPVPIAPPTAARDDAPKASADLPPAADGRPATSREPPPQAALKSRRVSGTPGLSEPPKPAPTPKALQAAGSQPQPTSPQPHPTAEPATSSNAFDERL